MNICRQAISKLSKPTTTIVFNDLAKCSTATVETLKGAKAPVAEEPLKVELDKLYKTIELELRSNDPAVVRSFAAFATNAATNLDVPSQSWALRKPQHDRLTLLKSVHIYKKHRVQYEYRTYFHFVKFSHLTGSTADTLLEYLQRNLPEGVSLKTSKVELQTIPDHLIPPQPEQIVAQKN